MKIGVIGLGSIGTRHAMNLLELGHDVWGYDTDRTKTAGTMIRPWDASNPEDFDGVVIASPTNRHLEHIKHCANKTRVFCEKPIADRNPSSPLLRQVDMVGYNLRFHAVVKQAKETIVEGLVGEPIWGAFVCAQFNDRNDYRRDGVILNWSHEIDLANYLLGPGEYTSAMVRVNKDGQDYIADILTVHGPTNVFIHLDYVTEPEVRGFTVAGTKGVITGDLAKRQFVRSTPYGSQEMHVFEDSFDENYMEEMMSFIGLISGQPKKKLKNIATAQDGINALKICLDVRDGMIDP